MRNTKKEPECKMILAAFTILQAELTTIHAIQKSTKLTFSCLIRYLVNESLKEIKQLKPNEIIRLVLQKEAEREINQKLGKE